jgi:hypothetical protein
MDVSPPGASPAPEEAPWIGPASVRTCVFRSYAPELARTSNEPREK